MRKRNAFESPDWAFQIEAWKEYTYYLKFGWEPMQPKYYLKKHLL